MRTVTYRFHNAEHAIFATVARIHCTTLHYGSVFLRGVLRNALDSISVLIVKRAVGALQFEWRQLLPFAQEVKLWFPDLNARQDRGRLLLRYGCSTKRLRHVALNGRRLLVDCSSEAGRRLRAVLADEPENAGRAARTLTTACDFW